MGRKSKLSEAEWKYIVAQVVEEKRPIRDMAKEYDIAESAIRRMIAPRVNEIRTAGAEIIKAEKSILSTLDIDSQILATNYAARLRSISSNLLGAADHQAAITHRLSAIAAAQLDRIDDSDPMAAQDALKVISGLNVMANDSSRIPMNLIAANKEQAERLNQPERQEALSLEEFYANEVPAKK